MGMHFFFIWIKLFFIKDMNKIIDVYAFLYNLYINRACQYNMNKKTSIYSKYYKLLNITSKINNQSSQC